MNSKFNLKILLLGTLLLLALLLRVFLGLTFPNILSSDEIFQTQEPAHRLIFGHGIVTWEFRDGIRSWILPGILAVVMSLTAWIREGSSGYITGIIIYQCLLSLSVIVVAFLWAYRTVGLFTAFITAGLCSVWFELVYFAPKALTEVVAAHLLLPGLYLGIYGKSFQPQTRLFLAGCLCGFALGLRIHLFPAIVLATAYICRKDWQRKWLPMMAGILGSLLVFGVVDAFTWSYPFQSLWKNIWVNVVEEKSHYYGVSPWYGYLELLINSWHFAAVPIIFLSIIGARKSPILAWLVVVIILSHSLLAHKEYRFIYPALPMAMILTGLGTADLFTLLHSRWLSSQGRVLSVLLCLFLWASISGIQAHRSQTINWDKYSGYLQTFQKLSTEKTVCGVGLWEHPWFFSGGYTHLHQDVPLFTIYKKKDFEQFHNNFNYLVAKSYSLLPDPNYVRQECSGKVCSYKRPGSCTQINGYHINKVLQQKGE
jgi:GPI mannosyltransferase 3